MADSLAVNEIPEKTENEIQNEEREKQDLEKEKTMLQQKQLEIENKLKDDDLDALDKSIAPK
jgi:hypothetical protein